MSEIDYISDADYGMEYLAENEFHLAENLEVYVDDEGNMRAIIAVVNDSVTDSQDSSDTDSRTESSHHDSDYNVDDDSLGMPWDEELSDE